MGDRPGMLTVHLQTGRERSLLRRHPWLLSGAVAKVSGDEAAQPGDLVRVVDVRGDVLGFGHYSPASSIRVRMLSFGKEEPFSDLIPERIRRAVEARSRDPLLQDCDALRLINAEADGLPGLVADRFANVVVAKLTSAGMAARREEIAQALAEATGLPHGFERADGQAARREGIAAHQGVLWGESSANVEIHEGRRHYTVDIIEGQKTGFYLDQRDSRTLVERMACGKRVLDCFSYTGGFAVAAAVGGAAHVTLVDRSESALQRAAEHLQRNAPDVPATLERSDVFEYLRCKHGEPTPHDLIIVDPPPLARTRHDQKKATRALKDLVLNALRWTAPRARLLIFSCSHHIDMDLFRKVVFGASLDAGRPLKLLSLLGAPSDHPISLDHPEGEYLRGMLVELADQD
jgi:23S rRNA (cytosine1962-C5)-methyltransferase